MTDLKSKAGIEAAKELLTIHDQYSALYERYKLELLKTGTISKEAIALRQEIDRRAERIYK